MKSLAILGAGGHAQVVGDIATDSGWDSVTYFDDAWPDVKSNDSVQIVGSSSHLFERLSDFEGVIVGVGNNSIREKLQRKLESHGARMVNIIHPTVSISKTARLGTGCALLAGSFLINNARIGDGVIINTNTSVDHDVSVGDFSHLSAGVHTGGGSSIGTRTFVGIGACTRHESSIGDDVIVGAGAVVVRDVPNNVTVVGNPARILR